ncbi:hypothetical protein U0035_21500 [Niabella yanshanensis]|uniref:Uncharacterized protein n=1 Tax=Niabella yanshanensis TaxID=577386 RepID=A0ABZ0W820_9BACT|nr:hypothetical protein [Niabella yanshanensis]WQD38250.1 hypothetical protein U0035_21500 [Niabella yanshanensis]
MIIKVAVEDMVTNMPTLGDRSTHKSTLKNLGFLARAGNSIDEIHANRKDNGCEMYLVYKKRFS